MSLLLYRLGRTAYRTPWPFVLAWLLILGGVVGVAANTGGGRISSSVTIDGTESQRVLDELRTQVPAAAGGQGTIVFTAPQGERLDTGARAEALGRAATKIAALPEVVDRTAEAAKQGGSTPTGPSATTPSTGALQPHVSEGAPAASSTAGKDAPRPLVAAGRPVPGVLVSADGSVAMLQLQFTAQVEDLPDGTVEKVVGLADEATSGTGVTALASDSLKPMSPPLGGHEAIGLAVAALVLLLTLGSLRAAGLPILTALSGVGIGLGGAFALSQSIQLTTATPVLALMVGLAVGMDYALFIVNRQRRLILAEGLGAEEAASRALGTAGSAVLFAGTTVVIALAGLTVIGISFLTTMALVAAATVVLAVLIALTLLPALLGLFGEGIVGTKARERGAQLVVEEHRHLAHRWSGAVVRHRWLVVLGVVALLGIAAVPMREMSLGMPSGSTANADTSERQSYDAITRGFGEGYNGPLVVVARPTDGGRLDKASIGAISRGLASTPDVYAVSLLGADRQGSTAIFSVVPAGGPDDSSTADLVGSLRDPGSQVATSEQVSLGVTGVTAVNIDISEKLSSVLPIYIAIIVGLSLVILLFVFRSVVVPIKATLGFLLSIVATFGITTAVFQWGWLKDVFGFDTEGPLLSFLPIMVTGILYGLAMDYEVFLVSSMREAHVHGHGERDAIVHGFDQASRVVVAAAVIMVSVFTGFIFSADPTIKQFGLALAVGILIDAFLVRMTLVPALMAILGRHAWWLPRWLDRLLPNLDVEGDRLKQHLIAQKTGGPGRAELRRAEDAEPAFAEHTEPALAEHTEPAFGARVVNRDVVPLKRSRISRAHAEFHPEPPVEPPAEPPAQFRAEAQGGPMNAFQVPVSRRGLSENRFRFTLDGQVAYDLPLPRYSPVIAAEALEEGQLLRAVLLACDSDEVREVIRLLDADQVLALAEAWQAA